MTKRRSAAVGLAAVAAGLLVLIAGLEAGGYPAGDALAALWRGAFGSWYALTSSTLVRATPLIMAMVTYLAWVETTPMFTMVSPFFKEGTARMNMTTPDSGAVMSCSGRFR